MWCTRNSPTPRVTPLCQGAFAASLQPWVQSRHQLLQAEPWAPSPSTLPQSLVLSLQACSQDVPGLCKKTHFPAGCHTVCWNNCVLQGEVMCINYCDRQQEIDLICALIQYLFTSKRGSVDSLLLQHIPISNIIHSTVLSATAKDIQKSNLKNLFLIL